MSHGEGESVLDQGSSLISMGDVQQPNYLLPLENPDIHTLGPRDLYDLQKQGTAWSCCTEIPVHVMIHDGNSCDADGVAICRKEHWCQSASLVFIDLGTSALYSGLSRLAVLKLFVFRFSS